MDAEDIVRALAATLEWAGPNEFTICAICECAEDGVTHEPDCPWLAAREWVVLHPVLAEGPTGATGPTSLPVSVRLHPDDARAVEVKDGPSPSE